MRSKIAKALGCYRSNVPIDSVNGSLDQVFSDVRYVLSSSRILIHGEKIKGVLRALHSL
jgi:hypothetical protein